MSRNTWNTEKEKILTKFWGHKTALEISKMLSVSRGSVIGKAWRLGLCASSDKSQPVYLTAKPKVKYDDTSTNEGITLMELESGLCRWPITPHTARVHRYCGKKCEAFYCEPHMEMAYAPTSESKKYIKSLDRFADK